MDKTENRKKLSKIYLKKDKTNMTGLITFLRKAQDLDMKWSEGYRSVRYQSGIDISPVLISVQY